MRLVIAFLFLFGVFGSLERLVPLRKEQKWFRQGWWTDVAHFFLNHFLISGGTFLIFVGMYLLLRPVPLSPLQTIVRDQSGGLQFLEAFLIAQLTFYGLHRLTHRIPWLWRFHAIHHSSQELDWLASARLHPVDQILTNVGTGLPLFLLGFTKETFGAYLIIGTILPIFNHANVDWKFPVLRWFLATPEFHHWHHSNDPEARDKNFSGLPMIDYLFGTFYMPRHRMPQTYGVDEQIPGSYLQQLRYPFQPAKPSL